VSSAQHGQFLALQARVKALEDLGLLTITPAGLALLDDADAAAQRTTLGVPWELIEALPVSAVVSYARTGLSAYRRLRLTGYAAPVTDGVNAQLRTSTNAGVSYDSGAADYGADLVRSLAGVVAGQTSTFSGCLFNSSSSVGNATDEHVWFSWECQEFNKARRCSWHVQSAWYDTAGAYGMMRSSGERQQSTARDAIQFSFSSGNIASGMFELWGARG
jgi:hypothetical protein